MTCVLAVNARALIFAKMLYVEILNVAIQVFATLPQDCANTSFYPLVNHATMMIFVLLTKLVWRTVPALESTYVKESFASLSVLVLLQENVTLQLANAQHHT